MKLRVKTDVIYIYFVQFNEMLIIFRLFQVQIVKKITLPNVAYSFSCMREAHSNKIEIFITETADKGMNANCLKTVLNVQTYWPHSLKHDVTKNDDH